MTKSKKTPPPPVDSELAAKIGKIRGVVVDEEPDNSDMNNEFGDDIFENLTSTPAIPTSPDEKAEKTSLWKEADGEWVKQAVNTMQTSSENSVISPEDKKMIEEELAIAYDTPPWTSEEEAWYKQQMEIAPPLEKKDENLEESKTNIVSDELQKKIDSFNFAEEANKQDEPGSYEALSHALVSGDLAKEIANEIQDPAQKAYYNERREAYEKYAQEILNWRQNNLASSTTPASENKSENLEEYKTNSINTVATEKPPTATKPKQEIGDLKEEIKKELSSIIPSEQLQILHKNLTQIQIKIANLEIEISTKKVVEDSKNKKNLSANEIQEKEKELSAFAQRIAAIQQLAEEIKNNNPGLSNSNLDFTSSSISVKNLINSLENKNKNSNKNDSSNSRYKPNEEEEKVNKVSSLLTKLTREEHDIEKNIDSNQNNLDRFVKANNFTKAAETTRKLKELLNNKLELYKNPYETFKGIQENKLQNNFYIEKYNNHKKWMNKNMGVIEELEKGISSMEKLESEYLAKAKQNELNIEQKVQTLSSALDTYITDKEQLVANHMHQINLLYETASKTDNQEYIKAITDSINHGKEIIAIYKDIQNKITETSNEISKLKKDSPEIEKCKEKLATYKKSTQEWEAWVTKNLQAIAPQAAPSSDKDNNASNTLKSTATPQSNNNDEKITQLLNETNEYLKLKDGRIEKINLSRKDSITAAQEALGEKKFELAQEKFLEAADHCDNIIKLMQDEVTYLNDTINALRKMNAKNEDIVPLYEKINALEDKIPFWRTEADDHRKEAEKAKAFQSTPTLHKAEPLILNSPEKLEETAVFKPKKEEKTPEKKPLDCESLLKKMQNDQTFQRIRKNLYPKFKEINDNLETNMDAKNKEKTIETIEEAAKFLSSLKPHIEDLAKQMNKAAYLQALLEEEASATDVQKKEIADYINVLEELEAINRKNFHYHFADVSEVVSGNIANDPGKFNEWLNNRNLDNAGNSRSGIEVDTEGTAKLTKGVYDDNVRLNVVYTKELTDCHGTPDQQQKERAGSRAVYSEQITGNKVTSGMKVIPDDLDPVKLLQQIEYKRWTGAKDPEGEGILKSDPEGTRVIQQILANYARNQEFDKKPIEHFTLRQHLEFELTRMAQNDPKASASLLEMKKHAPEITAAAIANYNKHMLLDNDLDCPSVAMMKLAFKQIESARALSSLNNPPITVTSAHAKEYAAAMKIACTMCGYPFHNGKNGQKAYALPEYNREALLEKYAPHIPELKAAITKEAPASVREMGDDLPRHRSQK